MSDLGALPRRATDPAAAGEIRIRVVITGAFLTGHPLVVRIDRYGDLQHALAEQLDASTWQVQQLHAGGGTFESGGGFADALPLVLARRTGPALDERLIRLLQEVRTPNRADGARTPCPPEPASVSIDIYDLGVAVLNASFDIRLPANAPLAATARELKRLVWLRREDDRPRSALVDGLQALASETAADYGTAIKAAAPVDLQSNWLVRGAPDDAMPLRPTDDHPGRLLWLHPVLVHAADDVDTAASKLSPPFSQTISLGDGRFAAGVGWSTIVTGSGLDLAATPVRLTELHWAYFALYMELDRGLLRVLNHDRWIRDAPLKQLEREADEVFAEQLRIMEARARLDSALAALGGDELAIWQTIAHVQRFDVLVEAVERKLEVLRTVAQRRVVLASASRSRRTSEILGGLTALTVVTVAIALISYLLGSRSDVVGHTWLRLLAIAAAFTLAFSLYWLAFRDWGAGRSRRRQQPRSRKTDQPEV